jgi:uncharacterized membrane protein
MLGMATPSTRPFHRFDESARSFEIGGVTASLYDTFAAVGLLFFRFLIGRSRATRPVLRSHRIVAGAAVLLGFVAGPVACVVSLLNERSAIDRWDIEEALGVGVLFLFLGAVAGVVLAFVLLFYVDAVRDEFFQRDWLAAIQNESTAKEMEAEIDSLTPLARRQYYCEFFATLESRGTVSDAHTSALRRTKGARMPSRKN